MPKLPRLSGRELIKLLEAFGFIQIRQKGSHIILKKKTPEGEIGTVVPDHKELAEGTLRGILKQAQITPDEFLEKHKGK
jgi:predicted RNA binding protein YcfA (HicA-like mRNA interferase family)